ncbi:hypothetical protein F5880DRAFT_1595008 [Lentinula raphanica]|nr:hypothetical protein F5880DRAFT_1595008 [Lentinula raphanica]
MNVEKSELVGQITSSQLILDPGKFVEVSKSADANSGIFTDSLIIPLYIAASSILLLLVHLIANSKPLRKLFRSLGPSSEEVVPEVHTPASFIQELKLHVGSLGGPVIYAFMLARLIGSLALLGLSIATLMLELEEVYRAEVDPKSSQLLGQLEDFVIAFGKWGKKHPKNKYGTISTKQEWLEAAMCLTFLYTSLLALISAIVRPKWSRVAIKHLNSVLLAAFCVYLYRDVYPLITFTLKPKDLSEGGILWAKIIDLAIISAVIPLVVPRPYVPADPRNPSPKPNPEQTASILSLFTYAFVDRLVFAAYRVSHLDFSQLPSLNDRDSAEYLKALSFKYLDEFSGAPRRHLFFGLMKIFLNAYAQLAIMILLHVFANFAAPVALNQLLRYLEPGGEKAVIRPWFWILLLFVGPVGGTLAIQWYVFVTTRTLVRTQAIITQLVFEHSLRIRVKAETADSPGNSTTSPSPETLTPESSSLAHEGTVDGSDTLHSVSPTEEGESPMVHSGSASVSSSNGKDQKNTNQPQDDVTPTFDTNNLVGKINNLVTTDMDNIIDGKDFLFVFIYIPVQIVLCAIFLYAVLGWSSFVGLGVLIVSFPLPGMIAKFVQHAQERRLKKTDARVQSVTESMNVLRMIKLFGWERKMEIRIGEKRDEELVWIRRRQILETIPLVTMIATFTVIMKQTIRASIIFSSMSVFDMLREQMRIVFRSLNDTMTAKVSLDRVSDFLKNTELLDRFSPKAAESQDYFIPADIVCDPQAIGFRNATFAWSAEDDSLTPTNRRFLLEIEGEVLFKRNCVNLVVGETGSGKTSLLMALLSEMHFIRSVPNSWYNLPRDGGIAYAAQESWVQNETIRENIVFGSPFDEERYRKVLYQCNLERDINLFEAGDATEVGEKGLTLSGGQKARITLARAVYSKAEIVLLDDCFTGDLMEGRTIILVVNQCRINCGFTDLTFLNQTHNIAITRPIAGFVVAIRDGRIESQGTLSEALGHDSALAEEAKKEQQVIAKSNGEGLAQPLVEVQKADGKLIVAEEIQEGHVSWSAVKMYLTSMGGRYSWTFFLAFIFAMLVTEIFNATHNWFLGYWASQYETHDPASVNVLHYVGIYCLILAGAYVSYTSGAIIYIIGTVRASRAVHKELIASIFGTTLRWLDTTPTSRVIARCTQDIRAVDGPVPMWLQQISELSAIMIMRYIAVVLITPIFFLPGIIVALLGGLCGQVYIKAQLSVKREMSNARAPVLGHFGAAIAGLTSIRAYGVQEAFKAESLRRIDKFSRAARTYYNLNRWITVRVDALGALLSCVLAVYLVYYRGQSASNTGFSLNMAVGFSSLILWWVRTLNEFEVQGRLERIQHYTTIEQEPQPTSEAEPPAYWPASGHLRVEKLSARYSPDGPKVLHDISFEIQSRERIGVVGRTGSGKSSLTLSLLRCMFTEGTVFYDGVATDSINLDALRSNITIIPQVPELLSGTLRQNLDPFGQYDDATLNDALRAAGLFALQTEMNEGRITLDSSIASGGSNLSVGQRQILALARALVRGSKLLILDEDYRTDTIIQDSLRNELGGDITLITVAHRLQTIMDADKIMVLDAGRIVEFDSPKALLKIKDGRLRSLVDQSNDRDILYSMAEKASSTRLGND